MAISRRSDSPPALLDAFLLFFELARIVVLAQHFDIAAQRQDADAVLRLAPLKWTILLRSWKPRSWGGNVEADVELLTFHTARFGGEEVTQLVHENDEAQTGARP